MPRPRMPDGLYTSVSQMKCWLKCPRQFELEYVRGVSPAFVPVNLAFGSAIHEALAAYYSELKSTGSPLRRHLVLDVFRSAWEKAVEGDVPLQEDEDEDAPGQLIDRGVSMLHAFHGHDTRAHAKEVEAVELAFTVPLHDPDTGEQLEEALTGFMDLVLVEDGRRVVVEHKTAARKYGEDQLRFDLQVSGYKLSAREAGMGEVGLRFQVLTKTKVPAVQIADVDRGPADEEDFVRTAVGVLQGHRRGRVVSDSRMGVSVLSLRGVLRRAIPLSLAGFESTPAATRGGGFRLQLHAQTRSNKPKEEGNLQPN